jgi:hypothetical protein
MKTTTQGIWPGWIGPSVRTGVISLAAALTLVTNGRLRAQTADLLLVPSNAVPLSATFYSIQNSNQPPLPFNLFPELDVYALSDAPGRYWVDDRDVDYAALREQSEMESALSSLEQQSGQNSAQGPPPIPGGGGGVGGVGGGGYQYRAYTSADLWLQVAGTTNAGTLNGTAYLVIHAPSGATNDVYDLFATTNLAPSAWQWVLRTTAGETNLIVTGLAGPNEFFILGTMLLASDGSGLTVAYEHLVGSALSSDNYGTPNAWYLQNDLNPLIPGIATQDPDQDGLLNWQEYLWGSSPTAAPSFGVWVSSPSGYSETP